MNSDFSNIHNVIAYCAAHKDALPDDAARGFIDDLARLEKVRGQSFYLTPAQHKYLHYCRRQVVARYPVAQPLSGIARMKERRDALNRKARDLGKRNLGNQMVASPLEPTASLPDVIEGFDATARMRRGRSKQYAINEFIGTARSQKNRK